MTVSWLHSENSGIGSSAGPGSCSAGTVNLIVRDRLMYFPPLFPRRQKGSKTRPPVSHAGPRYFQDITPGVPGSLFSLAPRSPYRLRIVPRGDQTLVTVTNSRLLTAAETAQALGVCARTVRRMVKRGHMHCAAEAPPGYLLFHPKEVARLRSEFAVNPPRVGRPKQRRSPTGADRLSGTRQVNSKKLPGATGGL